MIRLNLEFALNKKFSRIHFQVSLFFFQVKKNPGLQVFCGISTQACTLAITLVSAKFHCAFQIADVIRAVCL